MSISNPDRFHGKFAVLGIGPAGLTAAHAIREAGYSVDLFSKTNLKSELHGCQYLHAPLPRFGARETLVRYELWGTPDQYREKVYGQLWDGKVSPDDFLGEHRAWDIRETYDRLWDIYPGNDCDLLPMDVNPKILDAVYDLWRAEYDAVFSTIPAPNLCRQRSTHNFSSHDIWAVGDKLEEGIAAPMRPDADDIVVCNGKPHPSWYRSSSVFGLGTTEWPGNMPKPPVEGVVKVSKPLETDCDCYPGITRVGRYGAWKKSYLVHQVFDTVTSKVALLSIDNSPI